MIRDIDLQELNQKQYSSVYSVPPKIDNDLVKNYS